MLNAMKWWALAMLCLVACSTTPSATEEATGRAQRRVLTPSMTAYTFGSSAQIAFDGMAQTTGDWIAIARPTDDAST